MRVSFGSAGARLLEVENPLSMTTQTIERLYRAALSCNLLVHVTFTDYNWRTSFFNCEYRNLGLAGNCNKFCFMIKNTMEFQMKSFSFMVRSPCFMLFSKSNESSFGVSRGKAPGDKSFCWISRGKAPWSMTTQMIELLYRAVLSCDLFVLVTFTDKNERSSFFNREYGNQGLTGNCNKLFFRIKNIMEFQMESFCFMVRSPRSMLFSILSSS